MLYICIEYMCVCVCVCVCVCIYICPLDVGGGPYSMCIYIYAQNVCSPYTEQTFSLPGENGFLQSLPEPQPRPPGSVLEFGVGGDMQSIPWSCCSRWMISTKGLNRSAFLGCHCYHGDNAGVSATVSELDSKVSGYGKTPYLSELPLQTP